MADPVYTVVNTMLSRPEQRQHARGLLSNFSITSLAQSNQVDLIDRRNRNLQRDHWASLPQLNLWQRVEDLLHDEFVGCLPNVCFEGGLFQHPAAILPNQHLLVRWQKPSHQRER